jgi:hypothetical protein
MTRSAPSTRVEIAAFLALDQASVSGVALAGYRDGRMHSMQSGTATLPEHYVAHIQAALRRAGCMCFVGAEPPSYPKPCSCRRIQALAVVMEDHSGIPAGKGVGTPQLLGMGDIRGAWRVTLRYMGHPEHMRFMVDMPTWRGAVLGPRFARARKDVAKPEAVRWAKARTGRDEVGEDEAEALCILHWAASNIPQRLAAERLQRDLFAGAMS